MSKARHLTAATLLTLAAITSIACIHTWSTESTVSKTTGFTAEDPLHELRQTWISFQPQKVIGLFIGVSNYSNPSAQVFSTPAHTLGAALLQEQFWLAAKHSRGEFFLGLLADLRMDPNSPEAAAAHFLTTMEGLPSDPFDGSFIEARVDKDGTFNYLGQGKPVTKERILAAVEKASSVFGQIPDSWLVIYIAAHGRLASDGQPYLLPADATDSPDSWLSYSEALKSVIDAARGDEAGQQALVIFDACQRQDDDVSPTPRTPISGVTFNDLPAKVAVVQSTSPGQYAWAWPAQRRERGTVVVTDERRRGFPRLPARQPRGDFDRVFSSKMSFFPYASRRALATIARRSQGQTPVSLRSWFEVTQEELESSLVVSYPKDSPHQKMTASNMPSVSSLFVVTGRKE